ncbi:BZ3500_MvSof-1268-A1-R1_Chr1-3g01746 [Microbotryum saponariae]|uniref:BZ3500_MvSof-1268-A1-R1_Chr1-3g01746 protein n=1 Tax=Microbotryum saponariae TaxID=289078 RepID=A0A2X0KUY0_9BASI|nr:BZ3500_MvSof-1268-A1-R1_Chr1-3g01746 [Microbotryum saponariae]SCZ94508.1 BZ3501_MvSof-1269-A2-R1_Chr1-3g01348 [Microbotryum saponariae]
MLFLVAATAIFSSTARVEKLYSDSTRWGAVLAAARVTVPTIKSANVTLPELLSLPHRLPSPYAEDAKDAYDDAHAGWALVGHRRGFRQHSEEPALPHEHVWSRVGQKLRAKALLCKTAVRPARIPSKEAPHSRCFVGRWLHDRSASAVERDTHWRLMYDVTPTRRRQHTQGHASSPSCLFCGKHTAVIETVSHQFFGYSASFWGRVLRILLDKIGIENADVVPSTFTQEQLTMGLPLLRGRGRTTSKWMWVRLACAIGFQRLHLVRWRVHQRFQEDGVAGFVPGARDWELWIPS